LAYCYFVFNLLLFKFVLSFVLLATHELSLFSFIMRVIENEKIDISQFMQTDVFFATIN